LGKIFRKTKKRWKLISGKDRQDSKELTLLIRQLEQMIMVRQLEQVVKNRQNEFEYIRSELLHKAVDAGRAQLAAMLLHNIGNAITPVAVYTEKLKARKLTEPHRYLVQCYNDLLEHRETLTEYITEDSRGVEIMKYMGELIENLEIENRKTTSMVDKVATGIDYVAQILTLQRSYAPGRAEIKEMVNINLIINDALKMQELSISKHKIALETDLLQKIPHILIEKSKLMQVIVNLIKNSCDAIDENSEQTSHRLEITTYCTPDSVGIKIRDTGIGVEIERQKEIFDFGISSKGSSGFGLYYCKSFVEANKGTLRFESPGRGCGSTVTMEIPLSMITDRLRNLKLKEENFTLHALHKLIIYQGKHE